MLTGRPPFRGASAFETINQVLHSDPVTPSMLQPNLPRDLETICLKCLEKDPAKRYASAEEMADDLARFLRDEPIVARPVSLPERLWRWSRRNPRVAFLAGFVILLLVTGLPTLTGLWILADSRRIRAEGAERKLESERDIANETSRQARRAIRENFILATENPEFQRDGMQQARGLLLDKALIYFQQFTNQRRDDPELRDDLADAHERVAHIFNERGDSVRALAEYQNAADLLQKLNSAHPGEGMYEHRRANILDAIGDLEYARGRVSVATDADRRAFDIHQRLAEMYPQNAVFQSGFGRALFQIGTRQLSSGNLADALRSYARARDIFDDLQKHNAADDALQAKLCDCLVSLGLIENELGRPIDAGKNFERASEIRTKLYVRFPTPGRRSELARVQASLANAISKQDRDDDAVKISQNALDLREEQVKRNPAVPKYRSELATSLFDHASILLSVAPGTSPRFESVYTLRKRGHDIMFELVKAHGDDVNYQNRLAITKTLLAYCYRVHRNDLARGEALLTEALQIWEGLVARKVATPKHRHDHAYGCAQMALLEIQRRKILQAANLLQKANSILDELLAMQFAASSVRRDLSTNLANLTYTYQETRQWQKALTNQMRLIELRDQIARDHPQMPSYRTLAERARKSMSELAHGFVLTTVPPEDKTAADGRIAYQLRCKKAWMELAREFPSVIDFRRQVATWSVFVGDAYADANKEPEALAAYEEARKVSEQLLLSPNTAAADENDLGWIHHCIGQHYYRTKQLARALSAYDEASALLEKAIQKKPEYHLARSNLGRVLDSRGRALADLNDFKAAEKAIRRAIDEQAIAVNAEPKGAQHRQRLDSHYAELNYLYRRTNRPKEANEIAFIRRDIAGADPERLSLVASDFAQASRLFTGDPLTPEQQTQRNECITQAIATLQQASKCGFADTKRAQGDPNFAHFCRGRSFKVG